MTYIPLQRSFEQLTTPHLEEALVVIEAQYWDVSDQLEAIRISKAAMQNVLQERRRIEE